MLLLISLVIGLYVTAAALGLIVKIIEAVVPAVNSGIGTLAVVAVTAWVTFCWYRARHRA